MTDSRWARWAAGAGVLFVILLVVSFFIVSTPNSGDSASKISTYYLNHKTNVNISGLLTYLAVFAGAWFYVYLYRYYRSFARMEVPAMVSLVGAILFAASGVISAGFNFAFTDHTKQLNDGALVALNNLSNDLTFPMTLAGLSLFFAATGVVIRKAKAFPQWLAWLSWLIALVALLGPLGFFAFLATPIWTLIVCVMLWRMPARDLEGAQQQPAQPAAVT